MIKKIAKKAYILFLKARWGMRGPGVFMLADSYLKDYRDGKVSFGKIFGMHRRGFTVPDWRYLGLNKQNCAGYLSNVQYYGMHPLNGRYSAWIDDKLTLKYLCAGTELDQYMPEYYFHISAGGDILCLPDCPVKKEAAAVEDIAALLRQKGELALKKVAGSIGEGFYRAEYSGGNYLLNGRMLKEESFCSEIASLREYLVTEFLKPHRELAGYCSDTVNCIRYLLGARGGKTLLLKGFIRFGTRQSGFVENYNAGGVLCYLNADGEFSGGNVVNIESSENRLIREHPDTGRRLEGKIPLWENIVEACRAFHKQFPQLEYLGIDFVVTSNDKVKILEINSLTSLDTIQLDGSILESEAGAFFRERMRG